MRQFPSADSEKKLLQNTTIRSHCSAGDLGGELVSLTHDLKPRNSVRSHVPGKVQVRPLTKDNGSLSGNTRRNTRKKNSSPRRAYHNANSVHPNSIEKYTFHIDSRKVTQQTSPNDQLQRQEQRYMERPATSPAMVHAAPVVLPVPTSRANGNYRRNSNWKNQAYSTPTAPPPLYLPSYPFQQTNRLHRRHGHNESHDHQRNAGRLETGNGHQGEKSRSWYIKRDICSPRRVTNEQDPIHVTGTQEETSPTSCETYYEKISHRKASLDSLSQSVDYKALDATAAHCSIQLENPDNTGKTHFHTMETPQAPQLPPFTDADSKGTSMMGFSGQHSFFGKTPLYNSFTPGSQPAIVSPMDYSSTPFVYSNQPPMFPPMMDRNGDQTTSAANIAQNLSSASALKEPSSVLVNALETFYAGPYCEDTSIDAISSDKTPIEVVVGNNLNVFHIGYLVDVVRSEKASEREEGSEDDVDRQKEESCTYDWIVVDFKHWGQMKVPTIRCRTTLQPYPLPLVNAKINKESVITAPTTPIKSSVVEDPETPTNEDSPVDDSSNEAQGEHSHSSPGQNTISPPQWTPTWAGERKADICAHRVADEIDVYFPPTDSTPPRWVRGTILETVVEDPRIVLYRGLPIAAPSSYSTGPINTVAEDASNFSAPAAIEPWQCARFWGGYCQCSLANSAMPCLGLNGGIINADQFPFFYRVEFCETDGIENNCTVAPWQYVRRPNQASGLLGTEINDVEFALPPFMTAVPMGALALNTVTEESRIASDFRYPLPTIAPITEDQLWIESFHSRRLLNQVRHYSQILLYQVKRDDQNVYKITFIGSPASVHTANQYLNEAVAHIKSSIEFYERREKRLKLLEERKSRYEKNEQLQFEADDSLVGLIIGKQGEHLSKVARTHKVEIRVLPDDEGFRRVRIYGGSLANAQKAKNELNYCFKYLHINQDTYNQLTDRRGHLMKEIAQRHGVNSIWVDIGSADVKGGVRDATVVVAAQQAAMHPVKCRDIIRGTPTYPVLVICGVEVGVKKINSAIQKYAANPHPTPNQTLAAALGITHSFGQSNWNAYPAQIGNNAQYSNGGSSTWNKGNGNNQSVHSGQRQMPNGGLHHAIPKREPPASGKTAQTVRMTHRK